MPYGLEGEHNIKPTKEGLALRLEDEWGALLDLLPLIYATNPHLLSIHLCCDNDDHASSVRLGSRTQFTPNNPYLGTLGRQPSLVINDLLPAPLRVGKGRAAAVPRLRARD